MPGHFVAQGVGSTPPYLLHIFGFGRGLRFSFRKLLEKFLGAKPARLRNASNHPARWQGQSRHRRWAFACARASTCMCKPVDARWYMNDHVTFCVCIHIREYMRTSRAWLNPQESAPGQPAWLRTLRPQLSPWRLQSGSGTRWLLAILSVAICCLACMPYALRVALASVRL